jgi:hypothetical protein
MASFDGQISDGPMLFALLEIVERQFNGFVGPDAASWMGASLSLFAALLDREAMMPHCGSCVRVIQERVCARDRGKITRGS